MTMTIEELAADWQSRRPEDAKQLPPPVGQSGDPVYERDLQVWAYQMLSRQYGDVLDLYQKWTTRYKRLKAENTDLRAKLDAVRRAANALVAGKSDAARVIGQTLLDRIGP